MKTEVALVNMPFYGIDRPSLGLSLLKAALNKRNIPCDVHYLNLWFAKQIGFEFYKNVDYSLPASDLTGEWIFSSALWGEDHVRDRQYVKEVLEGGSPHHRLGSPSSEGSALPGSTKISSQMFQQILACRKQVEPFLERCLSSIDWARYRIVGFTSIFQQHVAALALASRLKRLYPHLLIVFGGPNCEGRMGAALFETFPFIDVVCSGEGDVVFPEFVEQVLCGTTSQETIHLLCREGVFKNPLPKLKLLDDEPLSPRIDDLDSLPYPDFDDFFAEHAKFSVPRDDDFRLLIETSRGCWWGETSHCTFCGLNGSTMAFRRKSPERVVDEIHWLRTRYGEFTHFIAAVDNIIPNEYFSSLLPALEKLNLDLKLFYETKSNLKKSQIELCSRVGLTYIQPGIESFSTPILQIMGKGSTALQNIQLLKWCRQFGISTTWNYLVGFPGESPEHYAGQTDLVDAICHLTPPSSGLVLSVRFDRFSPYFTRPEEFGVCNLQPYPSYRYVYPGVQDEVLKDLAYFFVGEFEGQDKIGDYTASLSDAMQRWHANCGSCSLFSVPVDDRLFICDFRPLAKDPIVILTDTQKTIYEECDSVCTRAKLLKLLTYESDHPAEEFTLDMILQPLLEQKLLIHEGGKYLALAIPLGYQYAPNDQALEFVLEMIESELEMRSSPVEAALGARRQR